MLNYIIFKEHITMLHVFAVNDGHLMTYDVTCAMKRFVEFFTLIYICIACTPLLNIAMPQFHKTTIGLKSSYNMINSD